MAAIQASAGNLYECREMWLTAGASLAIGRLFSLRYMLVSHANNGGQDMIVGG